MITVKLSKPITDQHGDVLDELQMREPTFGDLAKMDAAAGENGKAIALVQALSGAGRGVEMTAAEDVVAVMAALRPFLPDGPEPDAT